MSGSNLRPYVVAVKRDKRKSAPADWQEMLAKLPGVIVRPGPDPRRARIDATPEGVDELQRVLGDTHHVEPLIIHHRSRA